MWGFSVRDMGTQASALLWSLASFGDLVIKVIIHLFMGRLVGCFKAGVSWSLVWVAKGGLDLLILLPPLLRF